MKVFTRIKGDYSERRLLPRLGKIRLGLRAATTKGTPYPTETEYFVCPPEVQAVYGERPIELDVILPSDDAAVIFPQKLAMYGSGAGLQCHGDGVEAERYNEVKKQWEPMACPCEHLKTMANPQGRCDEKSHLMVMLPRVSMGGVYQITTGSASATANINSSLDMIRDMTGRIAMVPLLLRRVPTDMTHEGKKRTHYILSMTLNATWSEVAQLRAERERMLIPVQYQIAPPVEENPELDAVDLIGPDPGASSLIAKLHAKLDKPEAEAPAPSRQRDGLTGAEQSTLPPSLQGQNASAPNYAMTDEQWLDALTKIDAIPEWAAVKQAVKTRLKITDLRRVMPAKRGEVLGEILREGNAAGMVIAL